MSGNEKKIVSDMLSGAKEYGSLPFWSWNDRLEPEKLREQIRNMKSIGMNGFFMHARGGLETEYLGDEWFEAVNACIDEAKKLDMEAWSYDENGWPSGFAGGKLLEDKNNLITYLVFDVQKEYPEPDKPDPDIYDEGFTLGVYTVIGGKMKMVTGPCGEAENYIRVRKRCGRSYVDTLDAEVTAKFIEETHELYKSRIAKEDFGTVMPGFFTDEPQYYRSGTPWSNKLPAEFEKEYGYDPIPLLGSLFVMCEESGAFRHDFYRLANRLFINNFVKPIYDWCEENGCRLTGHGIEEGTLGGQMWGCGGIMPFYEYEHIPGVDCLGRDASNGIAYVQLASVCEQLGRKKALCETFACCGWDVNPTELKNIADCQFAGGVNLMCQHLYPVSERGQRKRDYPAHYSSHLPWQFAMRDFNDHYARLGWLLSRGTDAADTLVISPVRGASMYFSHDEKDFLRWNRASFKLHNLLAGRQILFHYGDEWLIEKYGKVEKGRFIIGGCSYGNVIISSTPSLEGPTAKLLKQFIEEGGKLWISGHRPQCIDGRKSEMPWLRSTTQLAEIESLEHLRVFEIDADGSYSAYHLHGELRAAVRKTDEYGMIYYLTNISQKNLGELAVRVRDLGWNGKNIAELDPITGKLMPVYGEKAMGDFILRLDFARAQSHLLVETDAAPIRPASEKPNPGAPIRGLPLKVVSMTENALTLDRFTVTKEDGIESEERPIERIRDELLRERYRGRLTLTAYFDVSEIPASLSVASEPQKYLAIKVNDQDVVLDGRSFIDPSFRSADIAPLVHVGKNSFSYTIDYYQRDYVYYVLYGGVSESLRNCLVFDTEIECAYLFGDFALKTDGTFIPYTGPENRPHVREYTGGFSVIRSEFGKVCAANITESGYPFFGGSIVAETEYDYRKGGETRLVLNGRYAVCRVEVNGEPVTTLMFENSVELAGLLKEGKNVIRLTVYNSLRNTLGPHHNENPEPYWVCPPNFSLEKGWKDGKCAAYRERYALVRFGVEIG